MTTKKPTTIARKASAKKSKKVAHKGSRKKPTQKVPLPFEAAIVASPVRSKVRSLLEKRHKETVYFHVYGKVGKEGSRRPVATIGVLGDRMTVAVCSPKDGFDRAIGRALVDERLKSVPYNEDVLVALLLSLRQNPPDANDRTLLKKFSALRR